MKGARLAFVLTVCWLCCSMSLAAVQGPSYNISDLGRLSSFGGAQATGINNAGVVVGSCFATSATGFYWDGSMHALPPAPPDSNSGAQAINSGGVIVGTSITDFNPRAVIYQGGASIPLSVGGSRSHALAINDSNHVVGEFRVGLRDHAFLWKNGSSIDLGTLGGLEAYAYDINNDGVVVGFSRTASNATHAYRWTDANGNGVSDPGEMIRLFNVGTSAAYTINNNGVIGGFTQNLNRVATLWSGATRTELPTLPGLTDSEVFALNSVGVAVGRSYLGQSHAVLWENGQVKSLADLLPPGHDWQLINAYGINDAGQIVGWGRRTSAGDSRDRAFLMTPIVPEPAGALIGAAMLINASLVRRPRSKH